MLRRSRFLIKILTLIRHAKSSWKNPGLSDRDRPLNKRGKRDAPVMGERLAERGFDPELVISSPAVRALATAEAIAEEIGYPWTEIVVDERLYEADASEWLEVIQSLDDVLDWVTCVGHNPGLTELVNYLSPYQVDNVPTCGVVELRFDTERWADIGYIRPTKVDLDYPKKRHF
jgi:phosphohistidine phosphatase